MDRRIVALQRVHHLSLIATRCAGELADGGRARFTRQRIDEGDAPAGFVDREAEHGRCVALTFIAAGSVRLLGSHIAALNLRDPVARIRSAEHTSDLQSLMRISYAVFCWKKKKS